MDQGRGGGSTCAIWAEAAQDGGAGWGVNGLALGSDGDFAVVADADAGLLAPDVGPPRALGSGTDDRAVFGAGLLVGGVGCLAEFAVDFVLVGVGDELVEQLVGPDQFHDLVGGQEWDQAFLPVVVTAFAFAFGVGRELHPMQTMQNSFSRSRIRSIRGAAGDLN